MLQVLSFGFTLLVKVLVLLHLQLQATFCDTAFCFTICSAAVPISDRTGMSSHFAGARSSTVEAHNVFSMTRQASEIYAVYRRLKSLHCLCEETTHLM